MSTAAVQVLRALAEHDDARDGAPPAARKVLSGLGFSEAMLERPTRMLSGGWRMRLAHVPFAPQLPLLDEPTNHLDLEAAWLDHYLTSGEFKGTLLVVSHDRHANSVVTDVVAFDQQKQSLKVYKGDVTNYEAVRADEKLRQQRLFDQQEARRAHLQSTSTSMPKLVRMDHGCSAEKVRLLVFACIVCEFVRCCSGI